MSEYTPRFLSFNHSEKKRLLPSGENPDGEKVDFILEVRGHTLFLTRDEAVSIMSQMGQSVR